METTQTTPDDSATEEPELREVEGSTAFGTLAFCYLTYLLMALTLTLIPAFNWFAGLQHAVDLCYLVGTSIIPLFLEGIIEIAQESPKQSGKLLCGLGIPFFASLLIAGSMHPTLGISSLWINPVLLLAVITVGLSITWGVTLLFKPIPST